MSMFRYNKCRFRVDITTALSLVRDSLVRRGKSSS